MLHVLWRHEVSFPLSHIATNAPFKTSENAESDLPKAEAVYTTRSQVTVSTFDAAAKTDAMGDYKTFETERHHS